MLKILMIIKMSRMIIRIMRIVGLMNVMRMMRIINQIEEDDKDDEDDHDESWWFMMIHDKSWWFMIIHDYSWLLMMMRRRFLLYHRCQRGDSSPEPRPPKMPDISGLNPPQTLIHQGHTSNDPPWSLYLNTIFSYLGKPAFGILSI